MDWAAKYWLLWLLVAFLPFELWAAVRKNGKTFSRWTWNRFNTKVEKGLLFTFLIVLSLHLAFEMTVVPVIVLALPVAWCIVRDFLWHSSK